MARIAREASEGIAVCSRILADCNGYRHPRKRFARRLYGRMRGRKTRAGCSPVRKERRRMPCRARVRLLKRHIQAYFSATFPIRKRRRAKAAQNSMWRCRLGRNALIPLEIRGDSGAVTQVGGFCRSGDPRRKGRKDAAGYADRRPRHTVAAYAPERRQKEAGGRECRKEIVLCGGVERAFCRESRGIGNAGGRFERPPAMRRPAAFQRVYIFRGKETPRFEQRASPPRDALFVGRRALQTFERSLKSGTVSVVSRVAHNGKEL